MLEALMIPKRYLGYFMLMGVGLAMVLVGLVVRLPYSVVIGNLTIAAGHLPWFISYFSDMPEDRDVLLTPGRRPEAASRHRYAA
jgi:hypothetical protein